MTDHNKRHLGALLVLCLIIGLGISFYFQRLQLLFKDNAFVLRRIQPLWPAGALRESAQKIPDDQLYKTVASWSFLSQDSLKVWEEKVFKGKTDFKVVGDEAGGTLTVESRDACSGLFVKVKEEATPDLALQWDWRALEFPKKRNSKLLANRREDDFAARVYVIFLAKNFFRSDVIEYVWDESLPVGTYADSAYSDRIKLLVIRSGAPKEGGGWSRERRNLREDYQQLFGKAPKNAVGMIALMSDSDNTATSAKAQFGEIRLKRKRS